ncbi:hypothetical protein BH23GEM8_BH23GEM8_06890 [soil metagenome]
MSHGVGARRLVAFLFLITLGGGCAHVEPPSGGPEDSIAPQLLVTRPDSLSIQAALTTPVVLVFDERISERGVEAAVMVSPRTSMVRVDHRRDELRVSLRGGWQPGIVYHITVLPEVQDLFGNRRTERVNFVFSTGPPITDTRVTGTVTDRITGRNEANIRVEAIRLADSLVYAVPTDSAGGFAMSRIPVGEYQIRAFQDMNRDRALDYFEPRDSAFVSVTEAATPSLTLAVLLPDTTLPQIASAGVVNRNVEVRFDDFLDPLQEFAPGQITITAADGEVIGIAEVGVGALDSEIADEAAQPAGAQRSPAAATLPSQTLTIRLADDVVLRPGVGYRVIVLAIRNVNGLVADGDGSFTGPPEAEPTPIPDPAGEVSTGGNG